MQDCVIDVRLNGEFIRTFLMKYIKIYPFLLTLVNVCFIPKQFYQLLLLFNVGKKIEEGISLA